jgi:hypothetical protein
MDSADRKDIAAALEITVAVGKAVQDLGSVPSGNLYARLMDRVTLQGYEAAICLLVRTRLVRRGPSDLLMWVGQSNAVPDVQHGLQI